MRRALTVLLAFSLAALVGFLAAVTTHATEAPKLTDVRRLTLTNLILARDNAQLRLDAFVKELSVDGYDLTTAGDYVPKQKETP